MIPDKEDIQALQKTDTCRGVVVGNHVYDPLIFAPEIVRFTRKQYLFLHHYRLGVPLSEAASKADMSVNSAENFLAKDDTVAWLQDRATKDHIRNEWQEPGKWWQMGNEVLEGRKHLSKDQQVVYMAFGERIAPKPKEVADNSKTTINFNFTAEDVKEAFKRQQTIDSEIIQEKAS